MRCRLVGVWYEERWYNARGQRGISAFNVHTLQLPNMVRFCDHVIQLVETQVFEFYTLGEGFGNS
jgi:hypothetical protein